MKELETLESINESIWHEEIRNEKKIHIARISIFALALVMATISRAFVGPSINTRFSLIFSLSAVCLIFGLFLWYLYKKDKYTWLAKYLLVTLDIFFISVLVLIVRITMSRDIYEITTDIPAFLGLFCINALSGLRFDFRLSMYCAIVSLMVLAGFTIYDFQRYDFSHSYLGLFSFLRAFYWQVQL